MTETQPDPQVEPDEDPRRDALRCIECEFRADDSPGGWYEASEHRDATGHRYEHVRPAPKPLTVADVPAGQGPASLHLAPHSGHLALWFKAADGALHFIRWAAAPGDTPANRALWEHLAATMPTITDKETP